MNNRRRRDEGRKKGGSKGKVYMVGRKVVESERGKEGCFLSLPVSSQPSSSAIHSCLALPPHSPSPPPPTLSSLSLSLSACPAVPRYSHKKVSGNDVTEENDWSVYLAAETSPCRQVCSVRCGVGSKPDVRFGVLSSDEAVRTRKVHLFPLMRRARVGRCTGEDARPPLCLPPFEPPT
ncbi:hypothetical protein E2C01_083443 [Portunus trituberculatus]|uniref:Uncharacterized protein n=1 Tax=Portunus trituberculatus TaxID=210409 RepID=A0A5B7J3I1_PORTR|nr:hypothetical protein [Portunus trituberculatus]